MPKDQFIVGTRASALALSQTESIIARLRAVAPEMDFGVKKIETTGDQVRDRALWQVDGRGFFVKEIENALRAGEIDLAVHSLKDVPTRLPEGLALGAVLERADPHDALIARNGVRNFDHLPQGARVGTSSLRRRAQLLAARPDLHVADLRGNVDTRLRKLRAGEYDAVVLAVAGLTRLGLERQIDQQLPLELMLPAPGQGALAVECRADDRATLSITSLLHHRPTWAAVTAERAFLQGLSSGCSAPVAAYAVILSEKDTASLRMQGLVASADGHYVVRVAGEGVHGKPEQLGFDLAEEALRQGADEILEALP
jgi:hydroxymethylbilane synthase